MHSPSWSAIANDLQRDPALVTAEHITRRGVLAAESEVLADRRGDFGVEGADRAGVRLGAGDWGGVVMLPEK